jgi:hypothetical protein
VAFPQYVCFVIKIVTFWSLAACHAAVEGYLAVRPSGARRAGIDHVSPMDWRHDQVCLAIGVRRFSLGFQWTERREPTIIPGGWAALAGKSASAASGFPGLMRSRPPPAGSYHFRVSHLE